MLMTSQCSLGGVSGASIGPTTALSASPCYREWRRTWERADILVSSNANAVRNSEEFRSLVSLGPPILPLVVDKLLQLEEFFALQIYDLLQDRPELRDEHSEVGEQQRALATARRWLSR